MTLLISILILILSLLGCMLLHLDLVYGLLVGMFVLMAAAVRSGYTLKDVARMMRDGIRESFIVVGVLLIIGAMTGIWRGCGTIPPTSSCSYWTAWARRFWKRRCPSAPICAGRRRRPSPASTPAPPPRR